MATLSSILACEITWTEDSGGLQFSGSQRDGYDWAHVQTNTHTCTRAHTHTHTHTHTSLFLFLSQSASVYDLIQISQQS